MDKNKFFPGCTAKGTRQLLQFFSLLAFTLSFLPGCGGGGSGTAVDSGPGDVQNFFPLNQGDTWWMRETTSRTGITTKTSLASACVSGTKVIDGVSTTIIKYSNPSTTTSRESYLVKNNRGVLNYGDSTSNSLYRYIGPYLALYFPMDTAASFSSISKSGMDFGVDLDGDGINETIDVTLTAKNVGQETVGLPAGTFSNCARVELSWTVTVKFSSSDVPERSMTRTSINWCAPGVGMVKSVVTDSYAGQTMTTVDELTGCNVAGKAIGVTPIASTAKGVAPANSDTQSPGRPSVAFDGTNYLVVHRQVTGTADSLIGEIVSGAGTVLKTVNISTQGSNRSSISFDGNNYLVVFGRNGQILGQRVSPSGTVLDGPSGFVIGTGSDNPAVAFDGSKYLVVWGKFNGQYDIYGTRVGVDGQVLEEFPICTAQGEQVEASIAYGAGVYLVAWRNTSSGSGPAATTDIYGARVSADGTILDPAALQICSAPGVQGQPQVIFDGTNFFTVWVDGRRDLVYSASFDVYGTRITPAGLLLDGAADSGGIPINTYAGPSYSGKYVSAAYDGKEYLVAWSIGAFSNDPSSGVYISRVSKETGLLRSGPPDALGIPASGPPSYASRFVYPVICHGKDNSFLAWVKNIELSGSSKDIDSALIFPFVGVY